MRPGYRVRQLADVARALAIHQRLSAREAWPPERLAAWRQDRFTRIVRHAVSRSAFYRDLYRGIDLDGDLAPERLPTVDKAAILTHYDRVVTDPRLGLSGIREHLRRLEHDEYYLGRYRILSTSGSTGTPGIFAYDRREWSTVLASALRWYGMIGVRPRLPKRMRITAVGADNPLHVSVRMVESGDVGLFAHQRLTVETRLDRLVDALNRFQPHVLLPYPSVGAILAGEQRAGRLAIHPRIVATHTEQLTGEAARTMRDAWGVAPFNHYGLTEEPNVGSDCEHHRGLHLFEDLILAEVVDDANRPVPPGETGERMLVTSLYNRTQPLIRYEVTDRVRLAGEPCPCGRPFRLIGGLEGRREEVLHLRGVDGGEVAVSPIAIENAVDAVADVGRYQVAQRRDGLHVRLVPADGADRAALGRAVKDRLAAVLQGLGATVPPMHVHYLTELPRPRTIGAKLPLVTREMQEDVAPDEVER